MTKAQVDALWARIKAIFASKTELANKQDTLTAGTGITIDENNVISASGGGLDEISTPIYISLGTYNASTGAYSASLPTSSSGNATWINGIAPEIQEGLLNETSETTVYYIKLKFDVNGTEYYTPAKFVLAGSQSLQLYVSVDGVYISILFYTGSSSSATVTAYKLSHLVANEENKFYLVDLSVDDLLASPLDSTTTRKLTAMRDDTESQGKLILFHGATGDGNTLVPATITQYGSQFNMYLYYDGKNIHVTADPTSTTWEVTQTTPYVKPSGGIPSTDLSSAVQTSLGKADTAKQEDNVFWATRGTTTYDEIVAANTAGKVVACNYSGNIYYLERLQSNGNAIFYSLIGGEGNYMHCTPTNSWSGWGVSLESVSNKKATITGNESSAKYYPTTKAVADYVSGIVGDINTILDEINGEVI